MSFLLKVNMHGLCFYVPDGQEKAMHVLLIDPPQPAASAANGHDHEAAPAPPAPHVHEVHEPLLVVNELDLDAKGRRMPDFQYSDGNRMAAFRLRDLEFTLGGTKAPSLEVIRRPTDTCPTKDNLDAFEWVVPLSRLDGSLYRIDPQCLAPNRVHPAVAARVHLNAGRLGTSTFSSPASRPTAIWEFVSSDGNLAEHRQAIADVVQLQLKVDSSTLKLQFSSFRNGTLGPEISLRPRADEGEMTIWLKGMPIEDVLGLRPPQELVPGQSRSRDAHFAHFFDLFPSQGARQLTYVPQLAQSACSPGVVPPTIGQIHCPGGTS